VGSLISDHHAILSKLSFSRPPLPRKTVTYRRYKAIDIPSFKADLDQSSLVTHPKSTLDDLLEQYNTIFSSLVDQHAPEKTKTITIRPVTPWYNEEINTAKRARRNAERKWRSTRLTVHRQIFVAKRDLVRDLIIKAKSDHYTTRIDECGSDQKALFRVVAELLHTNDNRPLPDHIDATQLPNAFIDFFQSKITRIRNELDDLSVSDPTDNYSVLPIPDATPHCTFSTFTPMSEDDIRKIVRQSPTKSCQLDPVPTWLLKQLMESIIPTITKMVNLSLQESYVPSSMKKAHVTPLLKKPSLDRNILKNYRPVSNLSFISKIIEKVVLSQITCHKDTHHLHTPTQSAYRPNHSVETALLRINNDLLCSLDKARGEILVLLDLTAAFDTIDHDILLARLQSRIGISGAALQWFRSYLDDRSQCVTLNGLFSESTDLSYGVPQGSVSGPDDFITYTGPISDIVLAHNIDAHFYADDTQLYCSFDPRSPTDAASAMKRMELCVHDISTWMKQNKLQLNAEKTELLIITPPRLTGKITPPDFKIDECTIAPNSHVRNLGATYDTAMKFDIHVKKISSSCYAHLRNIGKLRMYLTSEATAKLIHALISSRLDNCNSLLYGTPDNLISRLQRVQNTAARILAQTRKYDHITPVLQKLHWLPVRKRIDYKILLLTYRCLNGQAPIYLSELLNHYVPSRALRSAEKYLLRVPPSRLKTCGERAFATAAPTLWNKLPLSIRMADSLESFKSLLKSHLYNQSYQ
jgi:hypothetical protein